MSFMLFFEIFVMAGLPADLENLENLE